MSLLLIIVLLMCLKYLLGMLWLTATVYCVVKVLKWMWTC